MIQSDALPRRYFFAMNEKQAGHHINLSAMWRVIGDETRKPIPLDAVDWSGESLPLVLSRKFNQPSNLAADSIIFLELIELPAGIVCAINGKTLGCCESEFCEFEVTELVVPGQNSIELNLSSNQIQDLKQLKPRVRIRLT